MVILADAEDLLDLRCVADIGIVYLLWIQFFHLFACYKAALMTETLFCQVLATVVSYLLLSTSHLLL